jgi:putative hydrolase of the HAD superfamily
MTPIRAITIDLDETLWPVGPTLANAEAAQHAWLEAHAPALARAFTAPALQQMRERLIDALPAAERADFGRIRTLVLREALAQVGDDPAKAEIAYRVFDEERQKVEFFPEVLAALDALAARLPLVALSNGTADVARVGIGHHFAFAVSSRHVGVSKPDPRIFHTACAQLGLDPSKVLHVGDDAALDIVGALAAGMQAAWVNRGSAVWAGETVPHAIVKDLAELVDWVAARSARW